MYHRRVDGSMMAALKDMSDEAKDSAKKTVEKAETAVQQN